MQHSSAPLSFRTQQSLITPQALLHDFPLTTRTNQFINNVRATATQIIQGHDNRLLVIVGPCSIHDPIAATEYGYLLKQAAERFSDDLAIIMRVYFEKPRTTLGWKGFISDPLLNGSFDVNQGLSRARQLLIQLNESGLPTATEFLDPIIPPYISDLISWCAIGARTSESQLHRELASGLPMPVGFKNSTDGNIKIAIDATQVARQSHPLLSISPEGLPTIFHTSGNNACHIVLRGSSTHTNYAPEQIAAILQDATLTNRIIVDCSHGNSNKMHQHQITAAHSLADQISAGSQSICGIMLESNLLAGKQSLTPNKALTYGQSITDSCISWTETIPLLEKLAQAALARKTNRYLTPTTEKSAVVLLGPDKTHATVPLTGTACSAIE